MSAEPEIIHRVLHPPSPGSLILCSDGLADLYEGRGTEQEVVQRWVEVVCGDTRDPEGQGLGGDSALALLKDGLGETLENASMNLTVDMNQAWLDDTTIVILSF